jgi:hypothetical protein
MTSGSSDPSPQPSGPLDTIRAFGVMVGGPLLLLLAVLASIVVSVIALAEGETPPWPALVGVGGLAAYVTLLRPWSRRWGTTPEERTKALPGDEEVPRPGVAMTRAVTVDAPPAAVWPWIAQIGQDRGGFYSYTWLENLAGCHMHNADRVHPEWQHRTVGDTVLLHPSAGLELTRFDPERSYALQGWYFALEPLPGDRTRLLARTRVPRGLPSVAYAAFIELPHFVMERKMLRNLKRLVESAPARRADGSPAA